MERSPQSTTLGGRGGAGLVTSVVVSIVHKGSPFYRWKEALKAPHLQVRNGLSWSLFLEKRTWPLRQFGPHVRWCLLLPRKGRNTNRYCNRRWNPHPGDNYANFWKFIWSWDVGYYYVRSHWKALFMEWQKGRWRPHAPTILPTPQYVG